uniref:RRM domain-containing protein n=1 Tax=Aegilops tauschii subsp. strangulata TaxID=200361 RepID=A0A453CZI7_AEGTS
MMGASRVLHMLNLLQLKLLKRAYELNGGDLAGRPVRLDFARERGAITPGSGRDNSSFKKPGQSNTAFVRGFDSSLGEEEIRSSLQGHFSSCGDIRRVSIPKDYDTGASKGIAYIEFDDISSLPKALELNGSNIGEGLSLFVDEAKPRADNREGADSGNRSAGRFNGGGGRRGRFDGGGGRRGGRFDGGAGRRGGGRFGRGDRGGRSDRGRGRGGAPPRQSAGTPSAGKKITFGDD